MKTTHQKLTALFMGVIMMVCCILMTVFPVFAADGDEEPTTETVTITFYNGSAVYGNPLTVNKDEEVALPADYPARSGDNVFRWWKDEGTGGIILHYQPGSKYSFSKDTNLYAEFGDAADGSDGVKAVIGGNTEYHIVYNGENQYVPFDAAQDGNSYNQEYIHGVEVDGRNYRLFKFDEWDYLVTGADWFVNITGLGASGRHADTYYTNPVSGQEWAKTWPIPSFGPVSDKFIAIAQGKLIIDRRPISVTTGDEDVKYGDPIPTDKNTIGGIEGNDQSGPIESDELTFVSGTANKVGKGQENAYQLEANGKDSTLDDYDIKEENLGVLDVYYEITYDVNGGTGTFDPQKSYEASAELISDVPTKENNKFLGWATSADATKAEYQPGATIELSDNTTLYAVWEEVKKDTPVAPKTGDSANIMLYASLCGASFVTLLALLVLRRRKHQ